MVAQVVEFILHREQIVLVLEADLALCDIVLKCLKTVQYADLCRLPDHAEFVLPRPHRG
jgi:hypothetical protein